MKETLASSIRVAGLVLVIYTLSKTPVHSMAYSVRPEYGITSYLLPFIIPIIAGIIMLRFPYAISKTVLGQQPDTISIDKPEALLQISLACIGVIFLMLAISEGTYHISSALAIYMSPEYDLTLQTFDYPGSIATIIEAGFSLLLILKSKTVSAFIIKQ